MALSGAGAVSAQPPLEATTAPSSIPKGNEVNVLNGTVELHVAGVPLADVLRLLSIKGKRNIVASPEVDGTVTANLYDVSFENALAAILIPNNAGYRVEGDFIYVYTRAELQAMAATDVARTEVFTLNYISSEDARRYIEPMLGERDTIATSPQASTGLDSTATEGGGLAHAAQDFVVVTAPRYVLDRVASVLKKLDVRPKQVLVEATILRAELDDANNLGIDFTIVGGVDLRGLGASSRGLTDLTLGQLPEERFEKFDAIAATDFAGDVPDGGITIGIIQDHIAMFVRALEEVTDTAVIANPKVLALNRQKGQVIVGRRDGYITTTVTETQAMQTVEFLETGTQLVFRPFIGDDDFIRVELYPKDSVGFVSAQGLPSEQTTEVTTNVIVRDGETILIGGLFREVTTDRRGQVPGFGGLPILGPLFRNRSDTTTREEVIILLTINVVEDHDAYVDASRDVLEYANRIRVGVRHGLMWSGRERLAQFNYRNAIQAVEAGDLAKARWHTTLALHNLPRFEPALQLRERLTAEVAWDEDAAPTRWFIYDLIARERGYPAPRFGVPDPGSVHDQKSAPAAPEDEAALKDGA